MNFGKYTLYSCCGTTANCNTYPVAFRILFGNEDKEGWNIFWNFSKLVHPSIDDTRVAIITDQAKGLTESIADVLPLTGLGGQVGPFPSFFSNLAGTRKKLSAEKDKKKDGPRPD
jgi:hypothetical protein